MLKWVREGGMFDEEMRLVNCGRNYLLLAKCGIRGEGSIEGGVLKLAECFTSHTTTAPPFSNRFMTISLQEFSWRDVKMCRMPIEVKQTHNTLARAWIIVDRRNLSRDRRSMD